jgi:hypothetical protein
MKTYKASYWAERGEWQLGINEDDENGKEIAFWKNEQLDELVEDGYLNRKHVDSLAISAINYLAIECKAIEKPCKLIVDDKVYICR